MYLKMYHSIYIEIQILYDMHIRWMFTFSFLAGCGIFHVKYRYRQISHISCTLVGNKIVDHSDVVGASPVGAAPTTSSFSTYYLASIDWAKTTARRDEKHLNFMIWCAYIRDLTEGQYHSCWCPGFSCIVWQWQVYNIDHTMNLQRTPHTSPSQVSYGVPFLFWENITIL